MTVFLSYAHQDVDVVAALRQDLEDIGQSVWIDTTLHGGQIWWDEILRQVRDCHVFIFAVSRHSLASEACLSECDYAADVNRPFLPVRIDDVDMTNAPERLRNTQHIDFKVGNAASAKALARSLSSVRDSTPVPDPLPAPPATPQSYRDRYAALLGPEPLSLDDQMNYFVRLTVDIDTANSDEALELLRALHEREDLSWKVRQMIDRFLADRTADAAGSNAPTASPDGDSPSIGAVEADHQEPESPPTAPSPRRRLWWALGAAAAVVIAVVVVLAWPDSKPAKVQQPENDACEADTCGSTPIRFFLDLAGAPDDIVVTLTDPYENGIDDVDQPIAREVGDGLQWLWSADYEDPIGTYSVSFANAANTVEQSFTVEPMTGPFGVVQRASEAISHQDWTAAAALDDRIADEFQEGGASLLDGEYPATDEKHWYPADASGETNAANTTIIGAYINYSVSEDKTFVNCELWTVDISGNTMRSDALPRDPNAQQEQTSRTGRLAPSEFSDFIREQCVAAADAT
jgi:TIR domain